MKRLITFALATIMTVSFAMTSFAGAWMIDGKNADGTDRWWYRNDDGTYPKYEWQWINGKCYHFDENGYMSYKVYVDGSYVNANGEWSVNGVVQTK